MTYLRLPIFAALALSMAWSPAALAQTTEPQQQAPEQAQGYSEQELQSYATAALQVTQINLDYQQKLQAAQTPEEQQTLEREAVGKMNEAVTGAGLTVEKYNEITTATQTDPQLATQVQEYMSKAQ